MKPRQIIKESKHINEILKHCSYNSLVLVDLDNTIIQSTKHLGGDPWFVNFIEYAANIVIDKKEAISLVISVYHAIQHHIDLQLVQDEAKRVMQILYDLDIPVIPVTARGSVIAEPTFRELSRLGVDFTKQWKKDVLIELPSVNGLHPVFQSGIIFCDGADKGICFDNFIQMLGATPEHVVMIDDKEKCLQSVGKALQKYPTKFVGLRYGYLDEEVKSFNLDQSMQELTALTPKLPAHVHQLLNKVNVPVHAHSIFNRSDSLKPVQQEPVPHQKNINRIN